MRPNALGALTVVCMGTVACASPTGSNKDDEFGVVVAELRTAVTQPVVSDLFKSTAYVTSALVLGAGGCSWTFDFPMRRYLAGECGTGSTAFTIYTAAEPDLPHRGTAFLLAFPLEPIGRLELHNPDCTGGIRVRNGVFLLHACPAANGGWTAMLTHGQANYQLDGSRETLDGPARTRHVIRLRGGGATITLQRDVITGIERAESVLLAERDGRVLRMEGYAGSIGPAYEATLDGRDAGEISWQGNAGYVTRGAFDAELAAAEDRLLREGEYLIRALGRLGEGISQLL